MQKIASKFTLSIISFVTIISIHQSSLAKSTTLNWANKLNSDSSTTINSHNSILNIGDKSNPILFAINWKQVKEFLENAEIAGDACIDNFNFCKNVFSFIFEHWDIIILVIFGFVLATVSAIALFDWLKKNNKL